MSISDRFTDKGLKHLSNAGISLDDALLFDERFDDYDIYLLHKKGIFPEYANSYDSRFTGFDVVNLINMGFLSDDINRYNQRFKATDIWLFCYNDIPAKITNDFEMIDGWGVFNLINEGIMAKDANAFDIRFSWQDIVMLIRNGIPSFKANSYNEHLSGADIIELFKKDFPGSKTHYTFRHLSSLKVEHPLKSIVEAGKHDLAENYPKDHIQKMAHMGLSADEVEKYDSRFDFEDVLALANANICYIKANNYPEIFTGEEIVKLSEEKITPQKAYDFVRLPKNKYNRFDRRETFLLCKAQTSLSDANDYDYRFNLEDIIRLSIIDCSPDVANEYNTDFTGTDIYLLYSIGLKPNNIPEDPKLQEYIHKILNMLKERRTMPDIERVGSREISEEILFNFFQDFRVLGTGAHGIVLLDQSEVLDYVILNFLAHGQDSEDWTSKKRDFQYAIKFSIKAEHEFNLLSLMKSHDYVVKPLGYMHGVYIKLGFIQGETLENLLKNKGSLPYDNTMKYGTDILNGIFELRRDGIYHRDIHERNLMIDEDIDRAIILDLSAATRKYWDIHRNNRAYGGNNDLISLGQVMYKMAAGHNLFNEGHGFTCYSAVKEGIKTTREKVYDDPELLQSYLNKVREDVKDRNLADLIVYLLDDDLWTQPGLEKVQETQRMFERYVA
ncbi:protein kinase [Candidatus Woesearchaeota archaeon]|nr:protein kinase [Candidatus Woesearchaeota archaeon]